MKKEFLELLCCPQCNTFPLVPDIGGPEIKSGNLECRTCRNQYPVILGIPRFVPRSNYADSFGLEWQVYGRVQIDSYAGNTISRDRFVATTEWEEGSMHGKLVLDAGCGGGRFTEIALKTGATVVAFDYSYCIDTTKDNLDGPDRKLHFAQANIYAIPFKNTFDAVFSMGVLQHTPDPKRAIRCLLDVLKPGGELVVDVYSPPHPVKPLVYLFSPQKWLFKPLLRLLPLKFLHMIIKLYVWGFLGFDTKILHWIRGGIPGWQALNFFRHSLAPILISNHSLDFPFLSDEYKLLWAQMNTFDQYSPKFTKPQTARTMQEWARDLGLEETQIFCKPGCGDGTALVLKGKKARK